MGLCGVLLCIGVTGLVEPDVQAARSDNAGAKQCKPISKSQAMARLRARGEGKILSLQLQRRGDRMVYRGKVLQDNGRVKTVVINAC